MIIQQASPPAEQEQSTAFALRAEHVAPATHGSRVKHRFGAHSRFVVAVGSETSISREVHVVRFAHVASVRDVAALS